MNLSEIYVAGGVPFMHPITLVFIANIVVILLIVVKVIQKKEVNAKLIGAVKQLGGLAFALGVFGTLMGLFFAFDSIEKSPEAIPFNIISGGLKVSLITVLYGNIVFLISLVAHIILKLTNNSVNA